MGGGGGWLDKSILKLTSSPVWALAGFGAELGNKRSYQGQNCGRNWGFHNRTRLGYFYVTALFVVPKDLKQTGRWE